MLTRISSWTILSMALLANIGCANINSIYRSATVQSSSPSVGHVMLIDAKQRAILSGTRAGTGVDRGTVGAFKTFCAEPSPDAFSAYAAALSGSGVVQPSATSAEAIKVLASAAFGEQAGSIGLRTQSITILRDSMFRVCESYMNRAINEHQVDVLHRRFQSVMVALLSIEQLTGPLATSQLTLSSVSKTGGSGDPVERAKSIQAAYTELDARKAALGTVQAQLDAAVSTLKSANDDLAKLKATITDEKKIEEKAIELGIADKQKDVDARKKALESAKEAIGRQETVIAALNGALPTPEGSVNGSASIEAVKNVERARSDVAIIADTIGKIVETTSTNNFISDECMAFYSAKRTQRPGFAEVLDGSLEQICGKLLDQLGSYYEDQKKELDAKIRRIDAQTAAMGARVKMASDITASTRGLDCRNDTTCQTKRFELLQKIVALQEKELEIVKRGGVVDLANMDGDDGQSAKRTEQAATPDAGKPKAMTP